MFKKYLEYSFSHVVLVPTAHQSESVVCTHDSSFFGFSSCPRPHRARSRVPRAVRWVLVSYLFYAQYQRRISVFSLQVHSSPTAFPLGCPYLCSLYLIPLKKERKKENEDGKKRSREVQLSIRVGRYHSW